MKHSNRARLSKLSLGLIIALAAAPVFAQSTSAGVGGQVVTAGGQPVAGAEVTITHVESGTVSRAITDASGRYNARGLRVGGPYVIVINKAGEGSKTQDGIYLELNQVSTVNAALGAAVTDLQSVQVIGDASAISVFDSNNKGMGTSVSGRQLETAVSGNRSLDDIARLDPRITVTDQNDGSISVAGQNNRFNNISVDGLSVSDPFGLNSNGLGFTGSPISPDTIAAYDIKVTEFDVTSDSVGANINAVTKSGTNDFHGTVYYALTDASSMVGNRSGADYSGFDQNKTIGATFGGPIIKDKLFFFLSYEDQKINGISGVGTDAVSSGKLTAQQVNDVASAFDSLGIKSGSYGSASNVTLQDKRTLAKLDWNISDSQRASFTFQRTQETKPTPYSSYVKDISAILPSNWYTVATKTDNYSFQLFSDWTENFTTELKIGYQTYDGTNGAAIDQPEVYACFTAIASECPDFASNAKAPWVIAGEDRYRHENSIASKRISGTFSGTYYAGNHVIKGGFDFLSNKVANVFGQLLHGSYGFYDKNGNGTPVDEILAGDYSSFIKNYLPTGVSLDDSAGTWKYTQISPFIQDTWQATDNLSIVYGVRVNIPKADHAPPVAVESATSTAPGATPGAPVWESRFGYPSSTTLSSRNKVILPRLAFNYAFNSDKMRQLRGGIGLFQTVPPYVWLTNPYTNNGVVSAKQYKSSDPDNDPFNADPNNQPGPTSAAAGSCATNATCQIDVLDPNFKLPTAWKFSLGFDAELPWGLTGTVEYQHLQARNAINYLLPNIGTPLGTLPDGRDSYWKTYPTPGAGIGSGTNNGSYAEINTRSTLLTNSSKGHTDSVTFMLSKALSNGFRGNFSITQTHSTEINPGTASQAYSNYNYVARVNPNDSIEAPSRYDIPLSLKASMSWDHAFFGDYKTTVSMYYNGHDGQPYSWTFGTDVNGDGINNVDLAYIPQVNDAKVAYKAGTTAAQIQAFQEFISNDPYLNSHRGQIAERNASHQPWINQLDVGFQQELPGFFKGNKFVVRLDIYNFLNLLNKDWGNQEGVGYFGTRRLAYVSDVTNGQYVYDLGTPAKPAMQEFGVYDTYTNPARVISRWQALLTVRYQF